ncbi:MAG: dihydrofolate reductase [Sarcina sp.]
MKLIAAVTEDWGVGKGNDLLFKFRSDLLHFKAITDGQTCIMGYKTFMSLPVTKNGVLPNRTKVVLCERNQLAECLERGADVLYTKIDFKFLEVYKDAFVIGGGYTWKSFANEIDTMYLTHIKASKDADVFFPEELRDIENWNSEILKEENVDGIDLVYLKYTKK